LTSMWMLPLASGDRVIGLVKMFEDSLTRQFTSDEINLIQGMTNQAAVAIVNAQLFEALGQEKRRLELLYDLSQSLATTLDHQEVASRALKQIGVAFEATQGAIHIASPERGRLQLAGVAQGNFEQITRLNPAANFSIGQGLSGWVAQHRLPVVVD